ncbi:MAG: hypothetical protein IKG88_04010, partial [Bacteroidales bacterium]|nr:hypothetical protein [Bacteroidales bacterium]
IVREWKEGKYIVYSRSGTSQSVSYHDNSSMVVRSAQIPSNAIINDFRIAGDMVYAGGKVLGTPYSHGLLACFDINDLLGSGGVFHATTFYSSPVNGICYNLGAQYLPMGVKRLALYHDGESDRVAFIADDTLTNDTWPFPAGCRRVGYGSASYTGGWILGGFNYNEDAEEQFTDITTTDNYIALVAWNCSHKNLEFVVHYKGTNYIPEVPCYDIYYFTDHKVLGRVTATALDGDRFALAYHYDAPTGAGVAVKIFNISAGVPSLQYSLEIPPTVATSSNCEMQDIRYVRGMNELWLLNDIDSPSSGVYGSYLYRIDLSNVYAGSYEARHLPGYKLHSLDDFLTGGYIVSGISTAKTDVHTEQNTSSPIQCSEKEIVTGQPSAPAMQVYCRPTCPIPAAEFDIPIPFTVDKTPMAVPCSFE